MSKDNTTKSSLGFSNKVWIRNALLIMIADVLGTGICFFLGMVK